jgi:hypothetical protein
MATSDSPAFLLGLTFGAVLGVGGTILVCMLTSCTPGPDVRAEGDVARGKPKVQGERQARLPPAMV